MADVLKFAGLSALIPAPTTDDGKIIAIQRDPAGSAKGFKTTLLNFKNYVNAGKAGGKTIYGGTGASENLTLESTSHATKGYTEVLDLLKIDNVTLTGNTISTLNGSLNLNSSSNDIFTQNIKPSTLQFGSSATVSEIVTAIDASSTHLQLGTGKAIYDAIIALSATQHEFFTATAGQTSFTILGSTPLAPTKAQIVVNGVVYKYGADPASDFIISGKIITWYNNNYTMQLNDVVQIWYDGPGAIGANRGSYSGTMPVAGANLVVTAASLGLTDARQITDATLWVRSTDQNWFFAGSTFAARASNFTIPTLSDPNLGDLVIQLDLGSTTMAGQPFKLSYRYQSTNFLT